VYKLNAADEKLQQGSVFGETSVQQNREPQTTHGRAERRCSMTPSLPTRRVKDGGAAFPRPGFVNPVQGTLPDGDVVEDGCVGMTLRDWFAGQFLAGNIRGFQTTGSPHTWPEEAAAHAYRVADAMLVERDRKPEGGAS
jgi:hypothetical protein